MDNKIAKLVVLEGGDSSGKSTQIKLIQEYIESKNMKCEFLHFPMYGDNEFSEIISAFLRGEYGDINEVDPYFVANIYAMDRFLYKPKLEKLLKENDIVILDRYVLSNAAFQAAKYPFNNLSTEFADIYKENTHEYDAIKIINWILQFEYDFLRLPHSNLTIFLDVPVNEVEKRISAGRIGKDRDYLMGKEDIHEKDIDFQRRVREAYIHLMENSVNYSIHGRNEIVDCEVLGKIISPTELFYSYKYLIDKIIKMKLDENR